MAWDRIEATAYWPLYAAAFLAIATWESFRPRRTLIGSAGRRWSRHGVVFVIVSAALYAAYRVSPVLLAVKISASQAGLLRQTRLPGLIQGALAVLLLDLVRYVVHRAYHTVPWLWRVHQVHHSDPELDVSTGARAHPVEAVCTQGATLGAIAVFGMSPLPVLLFEFAACVQSFFGHANAALPGWIERPLRIAFVTPEMHRIHHSDRGAEQRKNFGDVFPWWDHLFGSYVAEPAAGQDRMVVGLKGFQTERSLDVMFLLLLPFRREPAETKPANSRSLLRSPR